MHQVGDRIVADDGDSIGYVRFIGEIPGKNGTWYGVEWDKDTLAASRGASGIGNDGTLDGTVYFAKQDPENKGSFLKPRLLSEWRTLHQAILDRYIEDEAPDSQPKDVVVKVANDSKYHADLVQALTDDRQRFSGLSKLTNVSLNRSCIHSVDVSEAMLSNLKNVRSLDLSRNPIEDLASILDLVFELPNLRVLNLSYNRFRPWDCTTTERYHRTVEVLVLNGTRMNLKSMSKFASLFPNLRELRLHHNRLCKLVLDDIIPLKRLEQLSLLDISENQLDDWYECLAALSQTVYKLQHLICSSNLFRCLYTSEEHQRQNPYRLTQLIQLEISGNPIEHLHSLDALNDSFPAMVSLRAHGFASKAFVRIAVDSASQNGQQEFSEQDEIFQQIAARLPQVETINGTFVNADERIRAEKHFIKYIVQAKTYCGDRVLEAEINRAKELATKYDMQSLFANTTSSSSLARVGASLLSQLVLVQIRVDPRLATLFKQGSSTMLSKKLPRSINLVKVKQFMLKSMFLKAQWPTSVEVGNCWGTLRIHLMHSAGFTQEDQFLRVDISEVIQNKDERCWLVDSEDKEILQYYPASQRNEVNIVPLLLVGDPR